MNRVGVEGKGESVWLAWFLIADAAALRRARRGARRRRAAAARVAGRAPTPTPRPSRRTRGTAPGTAAPTSTTARRSAPRPAEECRIDSIAQSWSVHLRRRRPRARRVRAMRSLDEHLVREDARLLMLLTPAVRSHAARSRLHQGLPAGRARERRAVHPRRALGGARHRAPAHGDRAFQLFQMLNPLTHARTPDDSRDATRSSRTSSRPTSTPPPDTSAAAAGPGTPARRAGCIESDSRRYSASRRRATP